MKIKIILVLLLASTMAWAQPGNYFLSHYTPPDERIDYLTFGIAQDAKGVIYFANKRGVLEFDGRNWSLIATSSPVFTIASLGHEVFAGGFHGFGKLVIGPDNSKMYRSLSQSQPGATQIFSSLALKDKIYFANAHSVFVLSATTGSVDFVIAARPQEEFFGLIEITGSIYIKSSNGISKIEKDKLAVPDFPWNDNLAIEFSASYAPSNITLLGVEGGRIFLASTSGLRELSLADKDFLDHNIAMAATWLSDGLVAIGTLRGGVIFINPQTGTTQEITNFYTGLPDNEVFAMLADRNQGLWVAHDYGFTRIAPFLPFHSYSHYPGLEGNLLCAKTFQGQTYVGTTLGMFTLIRHDVYEEAFANQSTAQKPHEAKTKKGLFSFLKKNKTVETTVSNSKRILKSVGYAYKRVAGIEGKVTQLMESNNQLLAAGTFGLASVNGTKSEAITSSPVRSVYMSPSLGQLLASTMDDEMKSFVAKPKGWKETNLLDTLNNYVSYIFEDKLQNVWLCGRTSAIKIETVEGQITAVEQVPFSNSSIDESVGIAYGSEVYMATGGSFHRYDINENVFKKYDSLPGPKKYFASAGYFWFNDGHRWRTVDPRMQAALKLEWLGLFANIRFIAPAEKENLWVITANNELYKFSSGLAAQNQKGYPLFLREVRGQQNKFAPTRSIKVSQLENTVAFEFIQPDFLGMRAVEYRYRVKGLGNDWTSWATTNNIVNFSYLPTGTYKVDVQTRDLMGKISEAEQITLEVEPPYWRQSWFYLLEVVFFGALVMLSMRLSAGNNKYRLISQLLSMLTVIMLIQLVQAAVNAQVSFKTSPVLDFFVQVGIALLVLPVENYLRKFMQKGKGSVSQSSKL